MITKRYFQNLIVTLILLFGFTYVQGQSFSKNSIKLTTGIGISMGNNTEGSGFTYSVGFQREIWKDRLRFNPSFKIGHYSSRLLMDARDQHFTSLNLETNLNYDLIRIKSFSLVVACGGFINNSRGLKGTGGDPEFYTGVPRSEYISDIHVGGYLGGGFRINSPNKRTAISVMPFNVHFGYKYFTEFHSRIELDIKL